MSYHGLGAGVLPVEAVANEAATSAVTTTENLVVPIVRRVVGMTIGGVVGVGLAGAGLVWWLKGRWRKRKS